MSETILKRLESKFFCLCSLLLKFNIVGNNVCKVVYLVDFLHFFFFHFFFLAIHENSNSENTNYSFSLQIRNKLDLYYIMTENLSSTQFEALVYANCSFLFVILFSCFMVLFLTRKDRKKKREISFIIKLLLQILSLLFQLFKSFFLFYFISTAIMYTQFEFSISFTLVFLNYLNLTIAIVFSLLTIFYLQDSFPNRNVPWSNHDTFTEFIKFIEKILVIIFLYLTIQNSTFSDFIHCILFLFLLYILWKRITQPPNVDPFIFFTTLISETSAFLFILFFVILAFLDKTMTDLYFLGILPFLIVLPWICVLKRDQNMIKMLKNNQYNGNPQDIIQCIFILHKLSCQKQLPCSQQLALIGLFHRHYETCTNINCLCKTKLQKELSNMSTKFPQQNILVKKPSYDDEFSEGFDDATRGVTKTQKPITSVFELSKIEENVPYSEEVNLIQYNETCRIKDMSNFESIKKEFLNFHSQFIVGRTSIRFKKNIDLKILSAFIHHKYFNNFGKAMYELGSCMNSSNSSKQRFAVNRYKFIIDEEYNLLLQKQLTQKQYGFDMERLIHFEKKYFKFRCLIGKITDWSLFFWEELEHPNFNINSVNKIGSSIGKDYMEVCKQFEKLQEINGKHFLANKTYSSFLREIMNNDIEAEMVIDSYQRQKINKLHYQTGREDSILRAEDSFYMIMVSANEETFSQMVKVNHLVSEGTGFSEEELLSHKIEKVMPAIYTKFHSQLMLNSINNLHTHQTNLHSPQSYDQDNSQSSHISSILAFLLHNKGYLIPVYKITKLHLSTDAGLYFIALLKKLTLFKLKNNALIPLSKLFFIITNQRGHIEGISKQFFKIFGFPLHYYKSTLLHLKEFNIALFNSNLVSKTYVKDLKNGVEDYIKFTRVLNLIDCESISQYQYEKLLKIREKYYCYMQLIPKTYGLPPNKKHVNIYVFQVLEKKSISSQVIGISNKNYLERDTYLQINDFGKPGFEDVSSISAGSVQTLGDNRKNIKELKEFKDAYDENQTTRSLKILLRGFVITYLIISALIIVNYLLAANQNDNSITDLTDTNIGIQNHHRLAIVLIYFRNLINIANNIESDVGYEGEGRFLDAQKKLHQYCEELRVAINDLDHSSLINDELSEFWREPSVYIYYLTDDGSERNEHHSYLISFSKFIPKCFEISETPMESLVTNLAIVHTYGTEEIPQTESLDRDIWFLQKNGHNDLRVRNWELTNHMFDESKKRLEESKLTINTITIISISLVVLSALILVPMIMKIEKNKTAVFKFYNNISKEYIHKLYKQSKAFQNEFYASPQEKRSLAKTLKKAKEKTDEPQSHEWRKTENPFEVENNGKETIPQENLENNFIEQDEIEEEGKTMDQVLNSEEEINSQEDSFEKKLEEEKMLENSSDHISLESKQMKEKIEKDSKKKVVKILFTMLGIVSNFILYLIASYLLRMDIVTEFSSALHSLDITFDRGNNLFDVFQLLKEGLSTNRVTEIISSDSSTHYDMHDLRVHGEANEKMHLELMSKFPTVYQHYKEQINDLDHHLFCQIVYPHDLVIQGACEQIYGGLFTHGLTRVMYCFLSYARNLFQRFKEELPRETQYLVDLLASPMMLQYEQIVLNYAYDGVQKLEYYAYEAVHHYFDFLINVYFLVFILFMFFSFFIELLIIFFGGRYLKSNIQVTLCMLKIIPLEYIIHNEEVKKIYKSVV